MDWSPSKVIRIESGNVGISISDLRVLLQYYEVSDAAQVDELIAIARIAKTRPWWERYKATVTSPAFHAYLSYEGYATILRGFSPFRIPGILQTEEYMNEVFQAGGVSERDASLRTELRLERQDRLIRPDGPNLNFILDESVIRRPVRSSSSMRRQLAHLIQLGEKPNVTIRVMRFLDGMHPKCFSPYLILEFESSEQDLVVYLEDNVNSTIKEGSSSDDTLDDLSPSTYLEVFFGLEQIAHKEQARELLENAARDFT